MRFALRLLGTELLAVEIEHERPAPSTSAAPRPCRYQPPESPSLEAGGTPHVEIGFVATAREVPDAH